MQSLGVGIAIAACVAGAAPLMYFGKEGWGWLVLIAILLVLNMPSK